MNIWSSAADCVWAVSTHNVSFGGHLTSNWTIRRNSHNSSGSAVAVQLFQQMMQFSPSAQVLTLNMGASSFSKKTDEISCQITCHYTRRKIEFSSSCAAQVIGCDWRWSITFCSLKKGKPSSPNDTTHAQLSPVHIVDTERGAESYFITVGVSSVCTFLGLCYICSDQYIREVDYVKSTSITVRGL